MRASSSSSSSQRRRDADRSTPWWCVDGCAARRKAKRSAKGSRFERKRKKGALARVRVGCVCVCVARAGMGSDGMCACVCAWTDRAGARACVDINPPRRTARDDRGRRLRSPPPRSRPPQQKNSPTLGRPMMAMAKGLASASSSSGARGGGRVATTASSISPVPAPLSAETACGTPPLPPPPANDQNSDACKSAFAGDSHLLTANVTDFVGCARRSQDKISSSPGCGPNCPSTTSNTASASATPAAACASIALGNPSAEIACIPASRSFPAGNRAASDMSPPVSTSKNSRPPQWARA